VARGHDLSIPKDLLYYIMTGSSDVSRSKHKVEVLYNMVVLLMPDKDLHAYLANDNLNSLQSGLMTLILMIHRQYLDVWEL
jgi:hypothetical protein